MGTPTEEQNLVRSLMTADPDEAEDICVRLAEIDMQSRSTRALRIFRDMAEMEVISTLEDHLPFITPYLDPADGSFTIAQLEEALREIERECYEVMADTREPRLRFKACCNEISRRERGDEN